LGHQFSVVSCEKANVSRRSVELAQEQCRANGIDWHPLRYHKRPPILSTVWDMAAMRKAAARLHREMRFELVHCRSYLTALTGLALKWQFAVPFLFDMRGFWPDERVESGHWNLSNPAFRAVFTYFKRKERSFFAEAGGIVTLTRAARNIILDLPAAVRPAIDPKVIPCCVDFELFKPVEGAQRDMVRTELGIERGASVLCYLGSLGGSYLLDEMLGFYAAYRSRRAPSRFLFVTRESPAAIITAARRIGIGAEELLFAPAERDQVPRLASAADHGVAFKRASYAEKGCSPTKLGEMMALGLPVAVNAGIGDVDTVISASGAGVIVDGFEPHRMLAAVDKLIALGVAAPDIRASARRRFDLDDGVKAYDDVYRSIVSGSPA
jgi:glycosyltransferase involved in cell wall biosynthesis